MQAKERAGIKLIVRLVLLRDDCSDVNVWGIHLHNELIGIVWMKVNIHRSEQFLESGEGCLNRPHEGLQGGDKSGQGGCQFTGVIDKVPIDICKTQEALRLLLWRWSGPLWHRLDCRVWWDLPCWMMKPRNCTAVRWNPHFLAFTSLPVLPKALEDQTDMLIVLFLCLWKNKDIIQEQKEKLVRKVVPTPGTLLRPALTG